MNDRIELFAEESDEGKRLDVFLKEHTSYSRSRLAELIREGNAAVGSRVILKPSEPLSSGDTVVLTVPEVKETALEPQDIPVSILWEDEDMAVIDKPSGMVVHPAAGNEDGTLVNALLYHLSGLSGIGGERRPGIVHRLDKDTSGIIVIAKNDFAHMRLSDQFRDRTMEKHYLAAVYGSMKEDSGRIDRPIGRHPVNRKKMAIVEDGRSAVTEWTVLQRFREATLLDVHILTGRTHQIRVHMQSIGHPVLGDRIYAPQIKTKVKIARLMLHSFKLTLDHPRTGERMTFEAPLPAEFEEIVNKLNG